MMLCDLLAVRPGVTAVIGSGGKTSLITQLAAELRERGTVLLCTSTKMWLPTETPVCHSAEEVWRCLQETAVVYLGEEDPQQGKLLPPRMDGWAELADYVLVEADGAAGKPLKAHAPWEPVLPPERTQTICVVGSSGLGQPIAAVAHRPDIFAKLCGGDMTDPATPEHIAVVLRTEGLAERVFINQIDAAQAAEVQQLAQLLPWPTAVGSLRQRIWKQI